MIDPRDVIAAVRTALRRTAPLAQPPEPPPIDEPITRLVHSDIGLPELFARSARQNHMIVQIVDPADLNKQIIELSQSRKLRRVALCAGGIVERLGVREALRAAGCDARFWTELRLDELYDFDASVTDVASAVAETGSLVIRETPQHGRALSLVPPVHIAIVEPKQIVADLVDLFEAGPWDNTVIITGPSKTADIEMNLVTGVHGPGVVHVFILQG